MDLFIILKIKDFKDTLEDSIREIKSKEIIVWFKGNFRKDMVLLYV